MIANVLATKRQREMTATLHFDGFYYSGPTEWEDWHAGVRMHGIRYHYVRYYANGDWLRCYRDREFPFWDFSESVGPKLFADAKRDRAPRIADADPLCSAGTYSIDDIVLTEVLTSDWSGGLTRQSRFRILVDRIVALNDDETPSQRALLFQPQPARRIELVANP